MKAKRPTYPIRSLITKTCLFLAVTAWFAALPALASQSPAGCSANNLSVNIGVKANNVTNGTLVTWTVQVFNPLDPTSCDVTLGPDGLYFLCPGPTGLPTGTKTVLIPGNTRLTPGYAPPIFEITCLVNVNAGISSAQAQVIAPDSVVHKNPLRDDPADVNKTISVNIFRPCLTMSSTCTSALNPSGSAVEVSYCGTLNNCGDIFLQNVVVYSDHPVPGTLVFGPIILPAGASTNFCQTYTSTDNLCGPFVTVLNASGSVPLDVPAVVTATASSQCGISYSPSISVTKVCPERPVQPGEQLVISGVVVNTGNIALTNVLVVNNQPAANTVLLGPVTLPVGASVPYTGAYTVPLDSCGPYNDTVTATGFALCGGQQVTRSASASCPGTNTPIITVTKSCPAEPVPPGGTLTYTLTVKNDGNITLNNVVVYNDKPAVGTQVYTAASLAPGASATVSRSYTVPADSCGPYVDTLMAIGRDKCFSKSVTNITTASCPGTTSPAIKVIKTCPTAPVQPGGTLTYSVVVSNLGNVTLNNVRVYSDQPAAGTLIYSAASMAPRARATATGSYTVPLDSCGPYASTVTAVGTSVCGNDVTDSTTTSCPGTNAPAIRVAALCTGEPVQPGGLLTYSGTVSNAGNITLNNVVVVSDKPAAGTQVFTVAALSPGQVASFSGAWTVPADSCGPYVTSVNASGADQCFSRPVSSSTVISCPGASTPSIVIQEQCPQTPTPIGGLLVFNATVINTGNITLTDVVVVNNRPAAGTIVLRIGSLAPNQSTNFTGSFTVPASLNACSVTNTLNVTGNSKCGTGTVANSVTTICPVGSAPAISITKVCPTTPPTTGGQLTYSGIISNGGNVTLTGIQVYSDTPAPNTLVFSTNSLAAGATARFTASYQTPADACSVTDTLMTTATDLCGNPVTASTTTTCPLATAPKVGIGRACPATATAPGGALVFTGSVTNLGNVTLTNVTVVVDRPAANTLVFGPATLAPNQVADFTGSFTVPTNLNACTITYNLSVRGQDKCTSTAVTATTSASCAVLTYPGIVVTKFCPAIAVPPGGTLVYTGRVVNIGNITLNNVVVQNSLCDSSNKVVFMASSLLPGQTTNFTGSYTVPGDCCTVTDTLLAQGTDACTGSNLTDTATSMCPVQFAPRLKITKQCPALPVATGQVLKYTGTITNTGNITLTEVLVYNSISGRQQPVLGVAALAPGETLTYTSEYDVPRDFCGTDTITVEGVSICGDVQAADSVTSTCAITTSPAITVLKACPDAPIQHGMPVTYSAMVMNSGDVTLTNVIVVDSLPVPNTAVFGPAILAPGEVKNFTFTFTAPLGCDCCELVDTLTARGQDRCTGRQVVATSTAVCPYATHPKLLVALACPSNPVQIGDLVVYSGTVMNQGDITLTNVTVSSSYPADTILTGPLTLARGEAQNFVGSYVVAAGTPALSQLILTAKGTDPCKGTVVTARENCAGNLGDIPPVLAKPIVSGGQVTIQWTAETGLTYRLQSRASLNSGAWQDEPGDVVALTTTASKTVSLVQGQQRFFRVMIVQ
ncbi:MAG TPA: hypothetical protein VJA21_19840 [Verrucomicrobiae bacterium]